MRIQFKAKLNEVSEVTETDNHKRQRIVLNVPVYDTFTGEKIREQIFPAAILNDNIAKLQAESKLGEIVKCTCFLGSFKTEKEDKIYWNLSLNCIEMEIISN
ncbi:MAG: hypothetical protein IH948_03395 [Bacteroidetes bacterium]|nr:hypothetical protein [Bacteroidota bacterium]